MIAVQVKSKKNQRRRRRGLRALAPPQIFMERRKGQLECTSSSPRGAAACAEKKGDRDEQLTRSSDAEEGVPPPTCSPQMPRGGKEEQSTHRDLHQLSKEEEKNSSSRFSIPGRARARLRKKSSSEDVTPAVGSFSRKNAHRDTTFSGALLGGEKGEDQ